MPIEVYKFVLGTQRRLKFASCTIGYNDCAMKYEMNEKTESTLPLFIFPTLKAAREYSRGETLLRGLTDGPIKAFSVKCVLSTTCLTENFIKAYWNIVRTAKNDDDIVRAFGMANLLPTPDHTYITYDFTPLEIITLGDTL